MAMNWVKLYTSWEVMAGQLGCIEPDIAKRVKAVTTKIQSLWYQRLILSLSKKMRFTILI